MYYYIFCNVDRNYCCLRQCWSWIHRGTKSRQPTWKCQEAVQRWCRGPPVSSWNKQVDQNGACLGLSFSWKKNQHNWALVIYRLLGTNKKEFDFNWLLCATWCHTKVLWLQRIRYHHDTFYLVDDYLLQTHGKISLATRSLLELDQYILEIYQDDVEKCNICKKLCLKVDQ